jgi:hypothetical protein
MGTLRRFVPLIKTLLAFPLAVIAAPFAFAFAAFLLVGGVIFASMALIVFFKIGDFILTLL